MLALDRQRAGWSVRPRGGVTVREYREQLEAGRSIAELRGVGPDLQAVRLAANGHLAKGAKL
jgi:hypothetical protein